MTGDRFVLNYIECPGGYGLERDRSTGLLQCECEETRQILHCEDDQDSVLIEVRSMYVYIVEDPSVLNIALMSPFYSQVWPCSLQL